MVCQSKNVKILSNYIFIKCPSSGIIKTGFALTLINYLELMNFKRDRI